MRDAILNNFLWKVTALLLAVLAWYGFQPKDSRFKFFPETPGTRAAYTRYFLAHPITISKPATDTREFRVTPPYVDITLTSDEEIEIDGSDLRATVDVSNFEGETNMLEVVPFVPDKGGLKVERITPERVQVELVKP